MMKKWFMCTCIVLGIGFTQAFCKDTKLSDIEKAYTVIVMLESKPGKETELKNALLKVADKSRAEKSCFEYRLYQDNANPTKFGLYEKWKSQELHQEQFNKSYIQDFVRLAEPILAKPYQSFCGVEIQ